ncbi:hypothetical protein AVEN_42142-1 [Araneus ventricosus]|uniref:Uncharacterized protein n=1 Tax=Araneus ventricosus TaxID=182803 RepID=A0A4Y2D3K5_ARAVE|nr:hypothetical protein AVEN_42142-1 [Araneus ventricosus]
MLKTYFEATRGLFWDRPRNFEPLSEDDTCPGTLLSKLPHQQSLDTTYSLACNRPHTRRIFSGIEFRTTEPLGHRGIMDGTNL